MFLPVGEFVGAWGLVGGVFEAEQYSDEALAFAFLGAGHLADWMIGSGNDGCHCGVQEALLHVVGVLLVGSAAQAVSLQKSQEVWSQLRVRVSHHGLPESLYFSAEA